MTASDWRKILKQLRNKPAKLAKFLKHNKPKERKFGIASKKCESCLLYTSDAADELDGVDLGGRRIIKKKTTPRISTLAPS